MKEKNNRGLFTILGTLLAAILLVVIYIAYLFLSEPSSVLAPEAENYTGITVIDPPQAMPDFTLTNQDNAPINLSDLYGKPILLTFGFTHCPDVCPITLGEMRAIYNDLEGGDDLHFVFITVDGERDTPAVLADYFKTLRVDSFMIGMTGTEAELRELGVSYGLDFLYGTADEFGNYTVEHTAGMFLLDSTGQWIRRYTYGMKNEDIVADLREVLQ